ncbi:Tn3 family transposase [Listeria monocytogenes]|nr:Tn3 family transposase [Listeria monocytogenes]
MALKKILTAAQREQLLSVDHLSEEDFQAYFSFSDSDLDIINQHRGDINKLGFAIQLCLARYPGCSLSNWSIQSDRLISYVRRQLHLDSIELALYAHRNTRANHFNEILETFRYQRFGSVDTRNQLIAFLIKLALENDDSTYLMKKTLGFLTQNRIIFPSIATLEDIISHCRDKAESTLFSILLDSLTETQIEKLDELFLVYKETKMTKLAWLKDIPGKANPESFMTICKKVETITVLELGTINVSHIHRNRFLQLARLGDNYDAYDFSRFEFEKKYSLLIAFLVDHHQYLIDLLIEINDRILAGIKRKGMHDSQELLKEKGKLATEKLEHYASLIDALHFAKDNDSNPFDEIERVIPWHDLIQDGEDAKRITGKKNHGYLEMVRNKATYLRRYTPMLLKILSFKATSSAQPILTALTQINELKNDGKRKIPANTSIEFVSKKWERLVQPEEGKIDRSFYELVAFTELKNNIRSGNISVEGSLAHRNIDDYLISSDACVNSLTIPDTFDDYLTSRGAILDSQLQYYSNSGKSSAKMVLKKLEKVTPDEAEEYRKKLYSMIPKIRLSDLLIEVDSWTQFSQEFIHDSTGNPPNEREKKIVFATLLGLGMNIGLEKMAQSTPGITYPQLANTKQWRFYKEALTCAQSILVNFQLGIPIADFWGEGKTSASDGMRVPVGVSAIKADVNPHYKSLEKGATMIRSINDRNTSHHVEVVSTNTREATHTLDGLLYHEIDLDIEEHFTDTNGYTDQVFGMTALLGFHFEPRIRNIKKSQLFSIKPTSEYPDLLGLISGRINIKTIDESYEEIKRIAYSIQTGKVSSSLILGKLGSYARKNKVATALRELGRIEKSIFMIDYVTDDSLRRKITHGLNKTEAVNALARELFFGRRGKFMERDIRRQLQSASALNVLINAISIWNAVYLQEAYDYLVKIDPEVTNYMNHISPINWEHITFLGEYKFDLLSIPKRLRKLNIEK